MDEFILNLLSEKVVPAVGCTEPIAVALVAAKAHELLEDIPDEVEVLLSKNILKNGMGVGIPGTGMTGLLIATALGITSAKSADSLELLKNVGDKESVEAKKFIAQKKITLGQKNTDEKLYIEVICKKDNSYSKVIIAGTHTNFVFYEVNGKVLLDKLSSLETKVSISDTEDNSSTVLKLKDVYDFAINCSLDKISFILETAITNRKAAELGLSSDYGLKVGRTIQSNITSNIYNNCALTNALLLTTAAIDARMGGANVTIYSNSGSGDQGITVTLPVLACYETQVAKELDTQATFQDINEMEKLIRALTLSHLVSIYIKLQLGVLSSFCGVTIAMIGAACGITYLLGGKYEHIGFAIKNCGAGIVGMVCDGAKNGCSVKVASAVFSAFNAATMAIDGLYPKDNEGIIHSDVEQTIENIVNIGKKGMPQVDDVILEMMLNK